MDRYLEAAYRLHRHLTAQHWDGAALVGPDPIGKVNWRITRFVKSYGRWLPWRDRFVYLQAQGYWIGANLGLSELTSDPTYQDIAERCAQHIVRKQRPDGVWEHPPMPARRGFLSTVESVWACLGLVSAYRGLGTSTFLDAAMRGYRGIITEIGFVPCEDGLAVRYYAHTQSRVPNVTTMLLWLAGELYCITGDRCYLQCTGELVSFLDHSQMDNGELPYACGSRPHFQCYQYNAFQFLDLANYFRLTGDERLRTILGRMAQYLATGITARGSCRYDCFKENPETNYWAAGLAAALREADRMGLGDYRQLAESAYDRVVARQELGGMFGFSDRNYLVLADRRSYPRQQAMILYFLLLRARGEPRPQ